MDIKVFVIHTHTIALNADKMVIALLIKFGIRELKGRARGYSALVKYFPCKLEVLGLDCSMYIISGHYGTYL